jgi:hypothetical protein
MKKLIIYIFYFLSLCLFTGCATSGKSSGNSKKWIPAGFDPKNTVLLVEKSYFMTTQEKEMEEYMKKNYPYRFEFVLLSSIRLTSEQYSDTILFRYGLVSHSYAVPSMNSNRNGLTAQDFNFYDRANRTDYPLSGNSSSKKIISFKLLINAIVKEIKR